MRSTLVVSCFSGPKFDNLSGGFTNFWPGSIHLSKIRWLHRRARWFSKNIYKTWTSLPFHEIFIKLKKSTQIFQDELTFLFLYNSVHTCDAFSLLKTHCLTAHQNSMIFLSLAYKSHNLPFSLSLSLSLSSSWITYYTSFQNHGRQKHLL